MLPIDFGQIFGIKLGAGRRYLLIVGRCVVSDAGATRLNESEA